MKESSRLASQPDAGPLLSSVTANPTLQTLCLSLLTTENVVGDVDVICDTLFEKARGEELFSRFAFVVSPWNDCFRHALDCMIS
jgi:hypothetical protein